MKKNIILGICFTFVLNYCFPYSKYHDMEETSRVRYSYHDIPGYVYFEGFDFKGFSAESDGIEPMLSKTLDLLDYYGVKNEKISFSFIRYNFTEFSFYKLHSRRYCRRLLYRSIHLNSKRI